MNLMVSYLKLIVFLFLFIITIINNFCDIKYIYKITILFYVVRRNNWPPLPENCCWQPCFYLDINVEIQPEFQTIVTQLYKLWQSKLILIFILFQINFSLLL